MKTIVSFGGGVQSTAIALMVLQGKLPRPDIWLFADTGDEPELVYPHVAKWKSRIEEAGMRFEVLHRRPDQQSLSEHVIDRIENHKSTSINSPPFFVDCADGGRMPLRRRCTYEYKVRVLDVFTKAWAAVPRGYKGPEPLVSKWMGISYDEIQRSRISQEPWFEFHYPLIERHIRRADCIKMLADAGELAPRSACVYCPFHSDAEWRRVKSRPTDWAAAVAFERKVHQLWDEGKMTHLNSRPTLHRSGVPIDEIDFTDRQESLFGDMDEECWGVCGV